MSEEDTNKATSKEDQPPPSAPSSESSGESEGQIQISTEYPAGEDAAEKGGSKTKIAIILAAMIVGIMLLLFILSPFKSAQQVSLTPHHNASPPIVSFNSLHSSALNVSLTYNLKPLTTNSSINYSRSSINWGDGSLTPISESTHTYQLYGNYTIRLNVYDTSNGVNSTSKKITLSAPIAKPPVVHSSPFPPSIVFYVHQSGLIVRLNGTALPYPNLPTSGVKVENLSINWGDGTITDGFTQYVHNYSSPGTYHVKVSAKDSLGDTNSVNRSVVLVPNQNLQLEGFCPSIPPSLTINTPSIHGFTVALSGTQGPSVTSGTIQWGDGTTTLLDQYIHTYLSQGNYQINVTAFDKCGLRTTYEMNIQISLANYPPIVSLNPPNVTGYKVNLKGKITATAPGSSVDWSRTTIDWGDGNTTLAINGYVHNYSRPSTYNIAVVATDNLGDRNASVLTLKVPSPTQAIPYNFPRSIVALNTGQNLSVNDIMVVLENVAGPDRNGTNDAILGIYKDGLLSSTVTMLPLTTYSVNASGTHILIYVGQTFVGVAGKNWAEVQVLPLRS